MKISAIVSIILTLSFLIIACEAKREKPRSMPRPDYMCERGVLYMKAGYGITVVLDTNSKIIPCKEN